MKKDTFLETEKIHFWKMKALLLQFWKRKKNQPLSSLGCSSIKYIESDGSVKLQPKKGGVCLV